MVEKCKNCGEIQAKFPIKGQPEKSLLDNYKEKTIRWKNLFKMSLMDLAFILIILSMTWAYVHDTNECRYIIENPMEVCEKTGCTYLNKTDYSIGNFNEINFSEFNIGG